MTTHPWAWWGWALGIALAVSLTTNPFLLGFLGLAVTAVVLLRRTDDPWARSVGAYFALAGVILAIRLVFQVVIGASAGSTVLVSLPEVPLPAWAAGIRLGGDVTLEGLLATVYDALRLATMLLCLGAANALANPRRALRSVPAALYEVSVAVVIALSVAPQLVESTARVRRARRLRGGAATGWSAVVAVVVPVLADAVDRSLALAAGMEARGFGRTRSQTAPARGTTALLLAASMVLTLGGFLVLGVPDALPVALACLAGGTVGVVLGLRSAGRRLAVTHHRPDPWTVRDTALVASGLVAALTLAATSLDPAWWYAAHPSVDPAVWPALNPLMALVLAGALAPLALTRAPAPTHAGGVR